MKRPQRGESPTRASTRKAPTCGRMNRKNGRPGKALYCNLDISFVTLSFEG